MRSAVRAKSAYPPGLTSEPHPRGILSQARSLLPGLALAAVLAVCAIGLSGAAWLQANGIGALTLAIILGMIVGNTVFPRHSAATEVGVTFAKGALLRLGIILYGIRLTFQDIAHVGLRGVGVDMIVVSTTFGLACFLGTRVLGLDRKTSMLVGVGSSICGAAAVMATAPVVRARPEQVTVAVSTVVVFGTLAIFLYPALYRLNARYGFVPLRMDAYGLFAGSTIHEVAQVVAAGHAVSDQAGNVAVIAKMVRVMMLAPFLLALSAFLLRDVELGRPSGVASGSAGGASAVVIPWFAIAFIAVVGLNSLGLLSTSSIAVIIQVDNALLAMAMAALGLTTHVTAIRNAGLKPLALASALFAWLIAGGLAINLVVTHL